ncbi:hypothetical protein RYH73_02445 [Olivibacter sp. CPCC 100613]
MKKIQVTKKTVFLFKTAKTVKGRTGEETLTTWQTTIIPFKQES